MKIFFLFMKNEHTRHSLTSSWLLVSRLYNKKLVSRTDLSRHFCFIKRTNNSCRARQKREKTNRQIKKKEEEEKKTKKVKKNLVGTQSFFGISLFCHLVDVFSYCNYRQKNKLKRRTLNGCIDINTKQHT